MQQQEAKRERREITKATVRSALLMVKRIALSVTVTILCLYLSEAVLWYIDPARKLPPQSQCIDGVDYTWGVPIHNNTHGFRDKEWVLDGDTYRILALGDSFTWGVGLQVGQRWTQRLEETLDGVTVYNASVSGWQMRDYALCATRLAPKIRPDRIIIGFVNNDIHLQRHGYLDGPAKQRFDRRWEIWTGGFAAIRLAHLGQRIKNAHARFAYPGVFEVRSLAYDKEGAEWLLFSSYLKQIKMLSERRRCDTPILASLMSANMCPAYLRWHRQVERAARKLGYIVVTYDDVIRAHRRDELVVNALDAHPSATLHRLYAERIEKVLRKDRMTKRPWKRSPRAPAPGRGP